MYSTPKTFFLKKADLGSSSYTLARVLVFPELDEYPPLLLCSLP